MAESEHSSETVASLAARGLANPSVLTMADIKALCASVLTQARDHKEAKMDFGAALVQLKTGRRVTREGWNGMGMFLFLVPGSHFTVNRPPLLGIYPEGTGIDYRPHIDMKTAQGDVVPWVALQSDLLCEDWLVVQDAGARGG